MKTLARRLVSSNTRSLMAFTLSVFAAASAIYGCSGNDGGSDDGSSKFTNKDGGVFPGPSSEAGDFADSGPTSSDALTPDGPDTCAATSAKATISPVDMYVMLDRSYSMVADGRWQSVVNAVGNVVYDQRFWGMGMGLQYFPLQQLCTPNAYAKPDVPIATLPQPAPALITSLGGNNPWGNTPMVPALQGAVSYAKDFQSKNPTRTTVIVLATDGLPDESCQYVPDGGVVNSLSGVTQIAQDAANASPPIRTFVIGVGGALNELDQIALAGGSQAAILVNTTQGIEQQFMDALNAVRRRALACDYVIPPSEAGTIDLARVNVRFAPNDGTPNQDLTYVQSLANCSKAPGGAGWYYDDETNASRVSLCPSACETVKTSDEGQLDILFGCEIKVAPTVPKPVPK